MPRPPLTRRRRGPEATPSDAASKSPPTRTASGELYDATPRKRPTRRSASSVEGETAPPVSARTRLRKSSSQDRRALEKAYHQRDLAISRLEAEDVSTSATP